MKKIFAIFLFAFMVLLSSCTSTKSFMKNASRLKQINRVAVVPFVCNKQEFGYNIAESVSANLLGTRLIVIERSQLQRILEEQNLTVEKISQGDQSFVSKLQGVDALIMGSATTSRGFAGLAYGGNVDYISNCTARIVDVKTGEVLFAVSFSADGASTMSGVTTATQVGEKIVRKIAPDLQVLLAPIFLFPEEKISLLAAAEAGVTAVIQPGGSIRDNEVIEAADANNLAMVFTGMRHFKH